MDQATRTLAPRTRILGERAMWILLVSLGYAALGQVGMSLRVAPFSYTIIWPCPGFLAGALLLTPCQRWWTYLPGVALAHFYIAASNYPPAEMLRPAVIQFTFSTTLSAAMVLGARYASKGRVRFDTFGQALTFIVVAGVGVPAIIDAVDIRLLMTFGRAQDFWLSWRQWLLACVFPTITITPLIVLTAKGQSMVRDSRRRRVEILLLSALLFVVAYLAFGENDLEYGPALRLAPFPILLWAAACWGVWGVSLSLLVAGSAITLAALGGNGVFATNASTVGVVSLQVYLIAVAIPLMLLAALMEERRRAGVLLSQSQARTGIAAALTDTGLWQWDTASRQLWMTEHCRKMFGLRPDLAYAPSAFLSPVHPDDRPGLRAALDDALAGKDVQTHREFQALGPGGEDRWYVLRTRAERDSHGATIRVTGIFRDISECVIAHRQSEQLAARLLTLQEDERRNIAQALHDSTIQHLVAAGLITGMVERRVAGTEETRTLFDDLRGSLHKAVMELRTFTYLLRPPELEQNGLCEVLRKYVGGFGLRTGVRAKARLSPQGDALPIEQQRALLRIAQESLANVHRHAGATRVSVDLRRYRDEMHLVISDDGCGLPPTRGQPVSFGVGIPGMAARVRQLGGKIDVRSGARGAVVHACLPMELGLGPVLDPAPAPRVEARGMVAAALLD
jgi:signal transduction histidine kinase